MSYNAYDKENDEIIKLADGFPTVDAVPTEGSTRPVSSGGVYDSTAYTLRYLGEKVFTKYYDGDTTIMDLTIQVFEDVMEYVASQNNNYRYKLLAISPNPSAYVSLHITSNTAVLSKNYNVSLLAAICGYGSGVCSLGYTRDRNDFIFSEYVFNNNRYIDHSNEKPVNGKRSQIFIEEYELIN